jgi:hypothetical protein
MTRCFLCEKPLTPPWFKTGKFRMHTACRDLVREYFEATHRRLIGPKTANDNTPSMGREGPRVNLTTLERPPRCVAMQYVATGIKTGPNHCSKESGYY